MFSGVGIAASLMQTGFVFVQNSSLISGNKASLDDTVVWRYASLGSL